MNFSSTAHNLKKERERVEVQTDIHFQQERNSKQLKENC